MLLRIDPPFVPHLQLMVNMSYFPTEEFGNIAEQMEQVGGISWEKDIVFLKCLLPLWPRLLPVKQILHDDLNYPPILRLPSPTTQP
ncbi:hypothetical protein B0H14DRAFT_3476034 [Mycena olivaceomarginata]|nr:hypothetical protein B0H14DRAFT_3476034 [Mycena olivaceomarginata]